MAWLICLAIGFSDICIFWYKYLKCLISSVGDDADIIEETIVGVPLSDTRDINMVSCTEMLEILADMSTNKSADCYGLCALSAICIL